MVPSRQHFIVYEQIPGGVIILTLLSQVRNIEELIAQMTVSFFQEIDAMKKSRS